MIAVDGLGTHCPLDENEWLQIGIAPKNVDVLVCLQDGSRFAARLVFDCPHGHEWKDSCEGEAMETPTLWMPLPNSPVLKEQGI